jgi:zinc protease
MGKIKKDGPTAVDLNKVKETLIRQWETQLKENGFWLTSLQNHFLLGDKLLSIEEYKTFINSFTIADIKAISNKYLNTSSYVEVALTPAPKPESK